MNGDYGNKGFGGGMDPPVREGDILEVRIEAVGEKGDGIAKKDGFILFVPNTKEGQSVKIKVTKVLRKVGFAEAIGEAESPIEASASTGPKAASEIPEAQEEVEASMEDSEDFGEEKSNDTLSEQESKDALLEQAPTTEESLEEIGDISGAEESENGKNVPAEQIPEVEEKLEEELSEDLPEAPQPPEELTEEPKEEVPETEREQEEQLEGEEEEKRIEEELKENEDLPEAPDFPGEEAKKGSKSEEKKEK